MSISIDSLGTAYQTSDISTSASKLENTLDSDLSEATDEELLDACKEFEAYFIEQVYKSMEKTIPRDEETSDATGQLTDYYKGELIREYAETTSEQGTLGLAEQLYEQMKRNYNL